MLQNCSNSCRPSLLPDILLLPLLFICCYFFNGSVEVPEKGPDYNIALSAALSWSQLEPFLMAGYCCHSLISYSYKVKWYVCRFQKLSFYMTVDLEGFSPFMWEWSSSLTYLIKSTSDCVVWTLVSFSAEDLCVFNFCDNLWGLFYWVFLPSSLCVPYLVNISIINVLAMDIWSDFSIISSIGTLFDILKWSLLF